jgi:replicative DNA helicase
MKACGEITMELATDRQPPNSLEAEEAVLGSVLIDRDALTLVRGKLKPHDFHSERCAMVWGAVTACAEDGLLADFVTVSERLERQGRLEPVGGREYVATLLTAVPVASSVEHYAAIVKRHAVARRIITASNQIAQIGYDTEKEAVELRAEVEAVMQKVREDVNLDDGIVKNVDAIRQFLEWQDELEIMLGTDGSMPDTPWDNLNAFIPALMPGNMVVIAAPSGHGKTICGEGIAEHNARRGKRVLYIHPEIPVNLMISRQMTRYGTNIHTTEVFRGKSDRGETAQIGADIDGWPGYIDFCYRPGITPIEVGALIRREAALGCCDLVIVDYLHILQLSREKGQSDEMALGLGAGIIKTAGAMANVPVVLMAQVNREHVGRSGEPKLMISDIRGSGQVAEKANAVILVYNHSVANPNELTALVTFYVAKNTFGKLGSCEMLWDKEHMRFMPRMSGI